MSVMNSIDFITKLTNIANRPNLYKNWFPYNLGYYDGSYISFDCWNLVKAIINDPNIDMNYKVGYHAPAVGNMGDWDGWTILQHCTGVSNDFRNLVPGEFLYMDGHAGVYIGNSLVIECTCDWSGGVQYSSINQWGGRWKGNVQGRSWQYHGKLTPWIDYIDRPTGDTVSYQSYDCTYNQWLDLVISTAYPFDTAGLPHHPMGGIAIASPTLKGYCVREAGAKEFLPVVTAFNINDYKYGMAGNLRPIKDVAINDPHVAYRVKILHSQEWLDTVYGKNFNLNDWENGYAGNNDDNDVIDEIEIWRV